MTPETLVPVLIVFIVVGLPIMSMTLIKLAKIMKGESRGKSGKNGVSERDEAELMQAIHRTLTKLEQRIDALETIVIDKTSR